MNIKKFDSYNEFNYDILQECFIEVIDLDICNYNKNTVLGLSGWHIEIIYDSKQITNTWGEYKNIIPNLLGDIKSNEKSRKILNLIEEALKKTENITLEYNKKILISKDYITRTEVKEDIEFTNYYLNFQFILEERKKK